MKIQLSDAILTLILDHASQYRLRDYSIYALVNRQFNRVASMRLWHTAYLQDQLSAALMIPSITQSPRLLGQHVRYINLDNVHLDDTTFLSLMMRVPYLEILSLHNLDGVTNASFHQVPQHLPHLEWIHIQMVHCTPIAIQALADHCPRLCHVGVENVQLSPCIFAALVACPLTRLDLHVPDLLHHITTTAISDLLALPDLKQLTILDFSSSLFCQALVTALHETTTIWPCMTDLVLTGNQIDDTCAIALIQRLPHTMKLLTLKDSHLLTDRTLDTLVTCLPHMERVRLDGCGTLTHHGIRRLARGCARARCIYVEGCGMDATVCFPEVVHVDDCRYDRDNSPHETYFLGPHSLHIIRYGENGG